MVGALPIATASEEGTRQDISDLVDQVTNQVQRRLHVHDDDDFWHVSVHRKSEIEAELEQAFKQKPHHCFEPTLTKAERCYVHRSAERSGWCTISRIWSRTLRDSG